MEALPLRLTPGTDLRKSLEELAQARLPLGAFVIAGIGSLLDARLRFADAPNEVALEGPFEILSLTGTITPDGAHLHMSVADQFGRVQGGHVAYGNIVRTTAEILLAAVPGWQLTRELDAVTGFKELKPILQG
jgi:predicted DNA-binding protein with PD1-like motif